MPEIEIWYGSQQHFGHLGQPQQSHSSLALNQPYMFQFSVKSQATGSSLYYYHVWSLEKPDELLCDLWCYGREGEAATGSILLICLFADVTIGNINVEAI